MLYMQENDIFVMTNRPLNAIANGQIRVLVNHALDGDTEGSSASKPPDDLKQATCF